MSNLNKILRYITRISISKHLIVYQTIINKFLRMKIPYNFNNLFNYILPNSNLNNM